MAEHQFENFRADVDGPDGLLANPRIFEIGAVEPIPKLGARGIHRTCSDEIERSVLVGAARR